MSHTRRKHKRKVRIAAGPIHYKGDGFASWDDVLRHVNAGGKVLYQAPLDRRATEVRATLRPGGRRVHVEVPGTDAADPFNADSGHLSRFRVKRKL